MNLIAHRGLYNKEIKENTIPAFKEVINNKNYIGAEFDIHETLDHRFVVIHDSLINRTSNGKGFVSKMTYKELLKYNFGTKKNYQKIPLLEEVLEILKNNVKVIEIKDIISYNSLNDILNKEDKVYVASFYKKHIQCLMDFHHNYKLGLFNDIVNCQNNCDNYDFIGIYYRLINEKLINKYIYNQKEVFLFGIHDLNKIKNIKNNKYYYIIDEN